jgi:hypothetical protein
MKVVVWKPFGNPIKEEQWLNGLAARGYSLTEARWMRYVFNKDEKCEYTYRIDLLRHTPQSPEGQEYMEFLEGSGIEVISTYRRWIYLRKKNQDGPFEMYTDARSKTAFYKRLEKLWLTLAIMEMLIGLGNVLLVVQDFITDDLYSFQYLNLFGGALCFLVGILFLLRLYLPIYFLRKRLEKEMQLFE